MRYFVSVELSLSVITTEYYFFVVAIVSVRDAHLLQLLLGGESQSVHRVGPAVRPLAKLLGGFGEGHVGGDGAVDDSLAPRGIREMT